MKRGVMMKRPNTQEYVLNVSSAKLQLHKTSQARRSCVSVLGSQLSELESEVVERHFNFLREKKRIFCNRKTSINCTFNNATPR